MITKPLFLHKKIIMLPHKNFKHHTSIQMRFSDIDAMNHLNNATYLTYFEVARVKYLDEVTKADWDDTRYGLIVAKAEINYKQPVFYTDVIEVHTRCAKIGNKSFVLEYELVKVLKDGTRQVAAQGITIQVAYDYQEHQSIALLEQWKQMLVAFEQNPELSSS